jgi:hypothetical protein
MHSALPSCRARDLPGLTFASSACRLLHARWAAWNAGERLSTRPLGASPLGPGSAKFVTPCERMHAANLSAIECELELVVPVLAVGTLAAPHSAIATTQARVAHIPSSKRGPVERKGTDTRVLYRRAGNAAVTNGLSMASTRRGESFRYLTVIRRPLYPDRSMHLRHFLVPTTFAVACTLALAACGSSTKPNSSTSGRSNKPSKIASGGVSAGSIRSPQLSNPPQTGAAD